MTKRSETFNNLIDICINFEEDPALAGNSEEMFRHLLTEYFFQQESESSKNLELFISELDIPDFMKNKKTLFELDIDEFETFVKGNMINDSLAGKVMLSQNYLKVFYAQHPPSFSKLPEDIKFELMDIIKEKNENILNAFSKMMIDKEADKKRKIITLIALILKNICRMSGRPLGKLTKPAEDIITSIFSNTDEIFNAGQRQLADLSDDSKIKELIKAFFIIRQFKEINDITEMYKSELDRYRKRGLKVGTI